MMIHTDLFEFAYIPDWYGQLDELQQMALPESWRFRKPMIETKNTDTPILERYIHTIFRKLSIDYNTASDNEEASKYFHIENEHACFHTGLYTQRFKAIYACFDRNKKSDTSLKWFFRGFCDDVSPLLNHIEPLPEKPNYISISKNGVNFNPEWHIRVNVDHILCDSENLERIPLKLRKAKNLPLLLETAVEIARRKAIIEPGLVVPQGYQSKLQYLLPIYLTNMEKPDLAMTLTVMDRKAKIFCSDKCRMAWWNAHPKDVQRKSEQIFICTVCGGSFSAYASAKQKFCSRKCYGISKGGCYP